MITTTKTLSGMRGARGMCDELVDELREQLESFQGVESLKEIFWSILSYDQQRLSLSVEDLPRDLTAAIVSLDLFASHETISVVRAECASTLTQLQVESLCKKLEARFPTLLLILHDQQEDSWTIVYPDRSRKHHLRFLAIPGSSVELAQTAKALAALTAVDWTSEDALKRLDVVRQMDVFFPGAMPRQRWEFDPGLENTKYSNSYMRRKAAPVAELYEDIARFPLLTQEQERGEDLAGDVASDREMNEYRWRLVLHNIRLVINIAMTFPNNVLELDDLVQEGILGLISAARKYDPSRGNRFSTVAWYWIRQGIFRAINQNHNLIRWPDYRVAELIPANRGEDATLLSPGERYVQLLDEMECESSETIDMAEEDLLERKEYIEALLGALEKLDTRQKRILRLRFGLGATQEMTLEEVGQMEGVTRERIRQIQKKAVGKLKYWLPNCICRELEPGNNNGQEKGEG